VIPTTIGIIDPKMWNFGEIILTDLKEKCYPHIFWGHTARPLHCYRGLATKGSGERKRITKPAF